MEENTINIGEELKKAREAQGISIEDFVERTKIRRAYLEAIESNNFSVIPHTIALRGFIKIMCSHLQLNPKQFLNALDSEQTSEPLQPEFESTKIDKTPTKEKKVYTNRAQTSPDRSVGSASVGEKTAKPRKKINIMPVLKKLIPSKKMFIIVVCIIAIIILSGFITIKLFSKKDYSYLPPLPDINLKKVYTEGIPKKKPKIKVTIIGIGDTVIKVVRDKDEILFQGQIVKGEKRVYTAKRKLLLRVERANQALVSYNDEYIGKLSNDDVVKEKEFIAPYEPPPPPPKPKPKPASPNKTATKNNT
ncbi:helix-turn-helix domain-containing protein [Candidatus Margulisiibacteriota bacterium]